MDASDKTSQPVDEKQALRTLPVHSPDILKILFQPNHLQVTIRRMRAWQDGENEVTHPLRKVILLEYEDGLANGLAASVRSGSWSPSPAYAVLTAKRSGTFRELVFPSLVDTIVGRQIIDALEPHITKDDNNRVFFGRSHANADRQRGDYENWFKVWLDFTAEIGSALEADGFTYVFDTDITQFFPSVDRERAKSALAQRTQAHQTLLELLFYCLESWAPRVRYCPVPGLPIEPNDVSRLAAHNYLKAVDEHFVNDSAVNYLRWVDDTVVFVEDETSAHEVKRLHHLALREVGLSPNASKTSIMTAVEYGASRHPGFNRRMDEAREAKDVKATEGLIKEWYALDREKTPNWDKVATRLYSLARSLECGALVPHATADMVRHPALINAVFKYLIRFDADDSLLNTLLSHYGDRSTQVETRIAIARFLCNATITGPITNLVNSAIGRICEKDVRLGNGYAKALLLLCVNKHGGKSDRDRIRQRLAIEDLQDDQLRLHYLYVYYCRGELDDAIARAVRHQETPDIALLMRICYDARKGRLQRHNKCLWTCMTTSSGRRTIHARYLPFLHALLHASNHADDNVSWLQKVTATKQLSKIRDGAIRRFLLDELRSATR